MIAFLGGLSSIAWIGGIMYAPGLPAIAEDLQADRASIQFTLTAFMIAFAIAQIAYGPLSDRFGRRGVLLACLAVSFAGTIAVAMSPNVAILTVARVVQAVGGVGSLVLSRAMVADLFEGDRVRRALAIVNSGASVAPVIALAAGGFVLATLGWRGIFWLSAGISLVFFFLALLFLKETHTNRDPRLYGGRRLVRNLWTLLTTPVFLLYTIAPALVNGTMFAFMAGTPFVLIETMGLSPTNFGIILSLLPGGYILGNVTASLLPRAVGTASQMVAGGAAAAGSALVLVVLALSGQMSVVALTVGMVVYGFGAGLQVPSAMSVALRVKPDLAGAASSLLGTVQLSIAGAATVLVGVAESGSGTGTVSVAFLMSFLGLVLALFGVLVVPRLAAPAR